MTQREETLHAECKRLREEVNQWHQAAHSWKFLALCQLCGILGFIGRLVWYAFFENGGIK